MTLPLPVRAHRLADRLRQRQPHASRGKQVYLNTLAVFAVNTCLQNLGFETDLDGSQSQDFVLASLSDVADLLLPAIGRLECRVVLPEASTVHIPLATWDDRVGFVAVQLTADLRQATLLGFLSEVAAEEIPLTQLQPLADLLDHLESLRTVPLSQWFQQAMTGAWKTVETIADELAADLRGHQPGFAYRQPDRETSLLSDPTAATVETLLHLVHTETDRWTRLQVLDLLGKIATGNAQAIATLTQLRQTSHDDEISRQAAVSLGKIAPENPLAGVRRAKVVELGMQLSQHRVVLVVTLTPEAEDRVSFHLRLYPADSTVLPAGVQLGILDEAGTIVEGLNTVSEPGDDWLQLQVVGSRDDRFGVKVSLGGAEVLESFTI
jgi:hypothetical protein